MEQLEFVIQMQRAIELKITGQAMDDMYFIYMHHALPRFNPTMKARLEHWAADE